MVLPYLKGFLYIFLVFILVWMHFVILKFKVFIFYLLRFTTFRQVVSCHAKKDKESCKGLFSCENFLLQGSWMSSTREGHYFYKP
jgi:hypothetical protein